MQITLLLTASRRKAAANLAEILKRGGVGSIANPRDATPHTVTELLLPTLYFTMEGASRDSSSNREECGEYPSFTLICTSSNNIAQEARSSRKPGYLPCLAERSQRALCWGWTGHRG